MGSILFLYLGAREASAVPHGGVAEGVEKVEDFGGSRHAARHERVAARGAVGVVRERPLEEEGGGSQAVQVRGNHVRVVVGAEFGAEVVAHYEEDVELAAGGGRREEEEEEEEDVEEEREVQEHVELCDAEVW